MIVKLIFVWFKLITEKKNGKNEIVFFSTILIVTRKLDHYVELKKKYLWCKIYFRQCKREHCIKNIA